MILYILSFPVDSFACVGARPLSMGGAFIGLADDVNTVYWNPAGLAQIDKGYFTFMHIINNRDWINYNNFLSYVYPMSENSGIGVSHIIVDHRKIPIVDENDRIIDWIKYNSKWYVISYGSSIGKRGWFKKTYWGFNIREYNDKFYLEKDPELYILINGEQYYLTTTKWKNLGIDIGLLYLEDKKLSFGILIQDVNKPETVVKHIRNYRPGIAFKPSDQTILTFDIYNAFPEDDLKTEYRVGMEQKFGEVIIRAGSYGDTFTSAGFGYNFKGWQIDYALFYERKAKDEEISEGYKRQTHIISFTKKF